MCFEIDKKRGFLSLFCVSQVKCCRRSGGLVSIPALYPSKVRAIIGGCIVFGLDTLPHLISFEAPWIAVTSLVVICLCTEWVICESPGEYHKREPAHWPPKHILVIVSNKLLHSVLEWHVFLCRSQYSAPWEGSGCSSRRGRRSQMEGKSDIEESNGNEQGHQGSHMRFAAEGLTSMMTSVD